MAEGIGAKGPYGIGLPEGTFTPGSREWYAAQLYGIGTPVDASKQNAEGAEFVASMAPVTGELMSARDAWTSSGKGARALSQGNYGEAAGDYGNMLLGIMGAVPGAGIVARGTKRGAAWMDRNLPAGVNRLLDAAMPSDPKNTLPAFPAWHGSPHDFDEFKLDKIGTGEGAQAYGHGLYFAENPAVAAGYRERLSASSTGDYLADYMMKQHGGDYAAARKAIQDESTTASTHINALRVLDDMEKKGHTRLGRLYKTEIDAEPEDLLDWDKPLSEQPEKIRNVLWPLISDAKKAKLIEGKTRLDTGGDIYRDLGDNAHQLLREAGIPGIRYLDQGSRGAGEGTANFVIFDDKLVKITGKE